MDDNHQEPTPGVPEPAQNQELKNYKAEMDRKLTNMQNQFDQNLQQLTSIIQASWQQNQAAAQPQSREPEALDLYDAAGQQQFLQQIDQVVGQRVDGAINKYRDESIKAQQIYQDFPELQSMEHGFTQEVSTRYAALTPEQKQDDEQFRTLVFQVAAEQGLKPKKFRKPGQDDFSLGGKRAETSTVPNKDPDELDGIDPISIAWMEVLQRAGAKNIDPNNKEQLKKLKELSKRKSWGKRSTSPRFERPGVADNER